MPTVKTGKRRAKKQVPYDRSKRRQTGTGTASTTPAAVEKHFTAAGTSIDMDVADGAVSLPIQMYVVPTTKQAGPVVRIVRTWQMLASNSAQYSAGALPFSTNFGGGYNIANQAVFDMIQFTPGTDFPNWAQYVSQFQEFKVGKMTVEIRPMFDVNSMNSAVLQGTTPSFVNGAIHSSLQPGGTRAPSNIADIMSDSDYVRTRANQPHMRQYTPKLISQGTASGMGYPAAPAQPTLSESNPWITLTPGATTTATYNGVRLAFDPMTTQGAYSMPFQVYLTCSMYFRINL